MVAEYIMNTSNAIKTILQKIRGGTKKFWQCLVLSAKIIKRKCVNLVSTEKEKENNWLMTSTRFTIQYDIQ